MIFKRQNITSPEITSFPIMMVVAVIMFMMSVYSQTSQEGLRLREVHTSEWAPSKCKCNYEDARFVHVPDFSTREPGVLPRKARSWGRGHPRWDASSSQGTDRHSDTLRRIQRYQFTQNQDRSWIHFAGTLKPHHCPPRHRIKTLLAQFKPKAEFKC